MEFKKALDDEIQRIRERLSNLMAGPESSFKRSGRQVPRTSKPKASAAITKPPRRPVSAARKRAMKAQGSYLGAIRPLNATQRKSIKKLRETKGVERAIREAQRMVRSKGKPKTRPARKPASRKQGKQQTPASAAAQ